MAYLILAYCHLIINIFEIQSTPQFIMIIINVNIIVIATISLNPKSKVFIIIIVMVTIFKYSPLMQ